MLILEEFKMRGDIKEIDSENPRFQYEKSIDLYKKNELKECFVLLERSAAQGYPRAINTLGSIYYNKGDYEKAFQYWSKATELGLPDAKNNLGWLYYSGEGVSQDLPKAYELHSEAASSKCTDDNVQAEAAKMAAIMSFNGEGTEKNLDKAIDWLKIAAGLGMFAAIILSQRFQEEELKELVGKLVSTTAFRIHWVR
jgi:TPR repeat protein